MRVSMSAIDLFVVLCACVGLYGIYRINTQDVSAHAKSVQLIQDLQSDLEMLRKHMSAELAIKDKKIGELEERISRLEGVLKETTSQIDAAQEHLAKQRKSLLRMKDALLKKSVRVQHVGAIPVEVIPGTQTKPSKQIRQIKKQIDALSK